jgi:hypothetical protein
MAIDIVPLPQEAIEDYLISRIDMPFYNSIVFGQWFSGYNDITLKVSHVNTIELTEYTTLGWGMKAYEDLSAIDIFIRDNTENTNYPNAVYQLALFIKEVINEIKALPEDNIAEIQVTSSEDLPLPEEELQEFRDFSIYHLKILVASKYYKHNNNNN